MAVTTRRTPQENTVQSPTDNDDVEHSSLDSVSPTVPEDTPADNEVFHDSIDEENEEVKEVTLEILYDQIELYRSELFIKLNDVKKDLYKQI